jgi:hypothetical protein
MHQEVAIVNKTYFVIAELESEGFIIKTCDNLLGAKDTVIELFTLADKYPINQIHQFKDYLKQFLSYTINGNAEFIGKCKECTSNGLLSVYIIDSATLDNSLAQFISERQSTSYAVISEGEIIPEILFYSN